MRASTLVRLLILSAPLVGAVVYLAEVKSQLAWKFPCAAGVLVVLGYVRASLSLNWRLGMSFASGTPQNTWSGKSENSDAVGAFLQSDPGEAHWALILASVIRGALIACIWGLPIGLGWQLLLAIVVLKMTSRVRPNLAGIERREEQHRRDLSSEATLKSLREDKRTATYYLYLRPFHITGQHRSYDSSSLKKALADEHPIHFVGEDGHASKTEIPIFSGKMPVIGGDRDETELNPDFEGVLERGVRPLASLVALGRPGEALGSGRVKVSDKEWQETVKVLGASAYGFIVLPSPNEGTRWELEWLKEARKFRNCLFLMPGSQPGFDGAKYWTNTTDALKSVMTLPRSMGLPMMFCFDRWGTPHLAPVSRTAFSNVGRTIFAASTTMVQLAVLTLHPISTGQVNLDREKMIDNARKAAIDLWDGQEIWREIMNHPARSHIKMTASDMSPVLSERPVAVWWAGAINGGRILIEFSATSPLENVAVFSVVQMRRTTLEFGEVFVDMRDADPSFVDSQKASAFGDSVEITKGRKLLGNR